MTLAKSALFAIRLASQADRRSLVVVLVTQLVASLALGGLLLFLRDALGTVFDSGSISAAVVPAVAGLVLLSLSGVLRIIGTARQRVLTVRMDQHITALVLDSAIRAELRQFETADFHNRLQRAVFASRSQPLVVITALVAVAQTVFTVVAVSSAFLAMAWWLVPLAVLSALPVFRASKAERTANYELHHELSENRRRREYLEQVLTGLSEAKEVRALSLGPMLRSRWDALYGSEAASMTSLHGKHMRRNVRARLTADVLTLAVIGGLTWLVVSGALPLAAAVAALTGLALMTMRAQMITMLLGNLGESVLYLNDLRQFTTAEHTEPAAVPPRRFESLVLKDISFSYGGRPALRDVSVRVGAGEIVALVGTNGSGKTTLAKVLGGLYPPDSGELRYNGGPADLTALRETSAVVFQDFARYKLSATDNIAFGRPDRPLDPDVVAAAAGQADADTYLARLHAGYETVLSKEFDGGVDLSLGQWQRLALARAFYRDAPFVILDEPTASLDPEAEAELFGRMRELFAGRAVLLISHRFSSVRAADRIYVLDQGRVVEEGTHDQLMARAGTYARLFTLQAEAYLPTPSIPLP